MTMPNTPVLSPINQFPTQAIKESVQVQPDVIQSPIQGGYFTIGLGTVADQITPWGKNVKRRDQQLREFWHTEPYLAGAITTTAFRDSAYDWEIKHPSPKVAQAVT